MWEHIANQEEIRIELQDTEWPFEYTDHDRMIVRAIVVDDDGYLYFVRASRDDEFGKAVLIETSGGGVEPGENLEDAIRRELREELGIETDILCKIGIVSDYYNLIHRHNLNNYYLCRASSFGEKHLTQDEIESFHLSTLKLRYEEAVREYENCSNTKLGHLIANRELPVLKRAKEIMDSCEGFTYVTLRERPELKKTAAKWFHSKWGVPEEAYLECMEAYLNGKTELGWYLCLDRSAIVGGMGVIENDFHDRKDLTPNVCAVYTEKAYRGRGIAGHLLNMTVEDLRSKGISPVYLVTDHTGFYERYGWEFLCMVQGDGESAMTRMYIHK